VSGRRARSNLGAGLSVCLGAGLAGLGLPALLGGAVVGPGAGLGLPALEEEAVGGCAAGTAAGGRTTRLSQRVAGWTDGWASGRVDWQTDDGPTGNTPSPQAAWHLPGNYTPDGSQQAVHF
jgi:hypothetical protein